MQVSLPVLTDSACVNYYKPKGMAITSSTQVCAGAVGGGKDTCRGDSGRKHFNNKITYQNIVFFNRIFITRWSFGSFR